MIVFSQICFVWCLALRVLCYDDDFPDSYHYQKAFPEDIMVDVINNFGLALLEAHNEGNEDNMALSPYGAASVLVALKEGLRGYAAREVETSIHLPADLSVIRIGLRDVHRHLKSYFIPKEGFLAGLTLSNDKVELLRNYEDLLRFYGYDLESFNNPLYPDAFEGTVPPTHVNATPLFEMTTEKPTLPTTNLISMSTTPETTVTEEYKNAFSTTEAMITTTSAGKEDQDKQNRGSTMSGLTESITSTIETTHLTEAAVTEVNQFATTANPKATTIQNQVTKNAMLTTTTSATSSLPPTKNERTTREGNKMTTEDSSSQEEDMEIMSSVTEIFTVRSTLPMKTSTLSTDDINEMTTNAPSTLSIISENETTNANTVSTTQTSSEGSSNTTSMQMELTTTFGGILNSNTSGLNKTENVSLSDAATAESQVDSTSSNGVAQKEKDDESTTDITVTSITTSVSTSSSKFGPSNQSLMPPLTTEDITKAETTTLKFGDSSDPITSDYSLEESYGDESSTYVDSAENSTDNEILDFNSEDSSGTSTESTEDYDYSTENITETLEANKTRKSRSLVDFLVARYHDSFHANNRKGRHFEYEPEESMSFLVYGRIREPNINFMNYDAVLPFAYLPVLDALALSFPLDSSEYYLLLILPVETNGIDRLIYDLKRTLSLREIISSLNFTHVKAVIPSFMLKGYVILTSTLQKLGVRKIFEPRHADFSLMTEQPNLYVTNIEQAVTVTIRNYIDPEKLPSHRNLQEFRTVEFKADHPFLYFVMDSKIHVTLMAGKIVNPLNSRIR